MQIFHINHIFHKATKKYPSVIALQKKYQLSSQTVDIIEITSDLHRHEGVDICMEMGVTVKVVIDSSARRRLSSYVSSVGTYPVVTYHTITLNNYEQFLKRVMDIVVSILGIIAACPVLLVTAAAIKLDSPGPVIFKQVRVGKNGRHFHMYKFRSMYTDAEEKKS